MTKLERLLNRIRNNPRAVTFDELRSLLEAYGFELRHGKGSHRIFQGHVAGRKARLVIPFRKPHIKRGYVEDALALIDEIEKGRESNGRDN